VSVFLLEIFLLTVCVCSDIAKHLSLPPVKLHCSMLAEDAIKAAVKDYQSKREKKVDASEDSIAATA
jgi:hypothetical protein